MTTSKNKQRAADKRLQKKRAKRSARPLRRPGLVIEIEAGARYYDLVLSDAECEVTRSFASSTLTALGAPLAGEPAFTNARSRLAFQSIARKRIVKPDGPREEGYWVLTDVGTKVADALGVKPLPLGPITDSPEQVAAGGATCVS